MFYYLKPGFYFDTLYTTISIQVVVYSVFYLKFLCNIFINVELAYSPNATVFTSLSCN